MNAYTHLYLYQMCSDFVMYRPIHFIDDYFKYLIVHLLTIRALLDFITRDRIWSIKILK